MKIDFDFETLYKNEKVSLKEVFDTLTDIAKVEKKINA